MNTLQLFSLPLRLPFAVFLIALFSASFSFAASVDDLTFGLINNGSEYAVTDCDTAATGDLTIPATYMGKPVTQIGENAFSNCNIASVVIPEGVTTLLDEAFYNAGALVSVTLPSTVNAIGGAAFYSCGALESITLPEGLTEIVGYTFFDCSSLTSVSIPNTVTSIGDEAFGYCAFTEIIIPDSVTSIGHTAFSECDALTSITIPESVTTIAEGAFSPCRALISVYFEGSAPAFGPRVFLTTPEALTLYVQAEHLAGYQALGLGESLATYVPDQASGIYYTISSTFDRQNNQYIIVSEAEDASLNTQVQYTEDLAGGTGTWTTLSNLAYIEATNTADNTITRTITNVDPSVNSERFYRLFSQP